LPSIRSVFGMAVTLTHLFRSLWSRENGRSPTWCEPNSEIFWTICTANTYGYCSKTARGRTFHFAFRSSAWRH
jgi:hypothetical protein